MTEILTTSICFPDVLDNVSRRRWDFVQSGLTLDFCAELESAAQALALARFSKHDDRVDVEIDSHILRLPGDELPRSYRLLCEKLTQQVRTHATSRRPGLQQWQPNDITTQRFSKPEDQVSVHQDFSRDRELIVVCTIAGAGPFCIYRERGDSRPSHTCETATGSLSFLWAPPILETARDASRDYAHGGVDLRPIHEARPAYVLPRITISIRMVVDWESGSAN